MRRNPSPGLRFFDAALVSALVLGCASAPVASKSVPAKPTSSSASPSPEEWKVVHYPAPPRNAYRVELTPDGVERIELGGQRVERRGKELKFAEQALLEPLHWSCRSGSGWIHIATEGAVYFSAEFLGELHPIGMTDRFARLMQCGPAVVVDSEVPVMWSREGPRKLENPAVYARLLFSSAREGVALTFPDRVSVTHDGGNTFSAANNPDSVALEPFNVPTTTPGELKDAELDPLLRAWVRRAVASDAGRAVGATKLEDGTCWRSAERYDRLFVALRTPNGAITSLELDGACHLMPWGTKLFAHCYHGEPELRVLHPANAGAIPPPPVKPRYVFADPKGKWVFVEAWPFDEFDMESRKHPPMLRFDGRDWQVLPDGDPVGVRGDWLALSGPARIATATEPAKVLHVLDDDQAGLYASNVRLLEESVVFVRRPKEGPPVELVELELGTWRTVRRVPFPFKPTLDFSFWSSFSDSTHGVVGSSYNEPLVTTDGVRFRTLVDPSLRNGRLPLETRCSDDSCTLGEMTAWTRLAVRPEAVLLPPAPLPQPEPAPGATAVPELPTHPGFESSDYACVAAPKPQIEDLLGLRVDSVGPKSERKTRVATLPAIGGLVKVLDAAPHTISWRGHDENGDFEVQTPPVSGAALALAEKLQAAEILRSEAQPVLMARGFVVLFASEKLVVLRSDGRIVSTSGAKSVDAVPTLGGGALLHVVGEFFQTVIELGSSGEVARRRWFLLNDRGAGLLALHDGEPGLAFLESASATFFSITPRTEGVSLPLPAARLKACTAPTPAGALELLVHGTPNIALSGLAASPLIFPERMPTFSTAVGIVEATPKSACLREVLVPSPFSAELHAEGGSLRGVLVGANRNYPATCRQSVKAR